jgi:hypothetical protein
MSFGKGPMKTRCQDCGGFHVHKVYATGKTRCVRCLPRRPQIKNPAVLLVTRAG